MRQKSRKAILDASLRLFARKGYSQTTISDIAREIRISKGLIYNYFPSKEKILDSLVDEFTVTVYASPLPDPRRVDAPEFLKGVIHRWFDVIRNNSDLIRLGAQFHADANLHALMQKKQEEYDRTLVPVFRKLLRKLGSADPELDVFVIGAILDGIALNYTASGASFPLDRIEKYLIKQYCTPKVKVA